jgi:hypothetical protein
VLSPVTAVRYVEGKRLKLLKTATKCYQEQLCNNPMVPREGLEPSLAR